MTLSAHFICNLQHFAPVKVTGVRYISAAHVIPEITSARSVRHITSQITVYFNHLERYSALYHSTLFLAPPSPHLFPVPITLLRRFLHSFSPLHFSALCLHKTYIVSTLTSNPRPHLFIYPCSISKRRPQQPLPGSRNLLSITHSIQLCSITSRTHIRTPCTSMSSSMLNCG